MTLSTKELKAGMQFSKPVYVDGQNLLVPPRIPIKQKDIDRLIRWEIFYVETEGEVLSEDEIGNPEQNASMEPSDNQPGFDAYSNSIDVLNDFYQLIREEELDQIRAFRSQIEEIGRTLLDAVEKSPDFFQLLLLNRKNEHSRAISAINTAIIAVQIAKNLNLARNQLLQILIGCLLCDLGMLRISDEVLNKTGKLNPSDMILIKKHPLLSYQIITKELKLPDEIAQVALYHHEKWDGTGYPKGLKGTKIPLFARIARIADSYEAMMSKRPYRSHLIGYNAMKTILSDNGTKFDPNLLKIFLKCIGIYPIGSFVLLNDGRVGKILELNKNAPMRPILVIIFDEDGNKSEDEIVVNLSEESNLFIIKAIDPSELKD
ncbi:MAG: HD-GYP domain-containing protein [Spirochaetales bacterium]|nr:HD-GYP domain-containing protein [Spirochaetales bacterium]